MSETKIYLPDHAKAFLGDGKLPWQNAKLNPLKLEGLIFGGVISFDTPKVVILTADADIDTDGPGCSKAVDPWCLPDTSLRYSGGTSCDSRHFPGIVIPPVLQHQFGCKVGDFSLIVWHGALVACQVYDTGPMKKIGEISIYAGRASGIVGPNVTDKHAATIGNSVTDCVYVVFPGSGPGHAIAPDLIGPSVQRLEALAHLIPA
jgi:hypothetical protein